MKDFSDIISKLGLPAELVTELQEAWESQVEKNKQEALAEAKQLNESSSDVEMMVKAAEAILTETLKSEKEQNAELRNQLKEAQDQALVKVRKAKQLYEAAKQYSTKQKELMEQKAGVYEKFMNGVLAQEIKELKEEREEAAKNVAAERVKLLKQKMRQEKVFETQVKAMQKLMVETLQAEIAELHASRKENKEILESQLAKLGELQNEVLTTELAELKEDREKMFESVGKLENLLVRQLTEELSEFQEDKRLLAEQKVQLEQDAKRKIQEFKEEFVNKTSSAASRVVNETLHNELSALRQGIKEARENTFGRKIFEAFVGEFTTSVFNENTTARKLMKKLEESSKNIAKLQKIVGEQQVTLNNRDKALNEAIETSKREKTVSKLVASLSGVQKRMMVNLLENVETSKLEKEFNRYLPQVLERKIESRKVALSEDAVKKTHLAESTGKRPQHKAVVAEPKQVTEAAVEEDFNDINTILANAGINKKQS